MGVQVSNLEKFDVLLNGIKTALPTTYELVRTLTGVPCTSVELAAQGRDLLLVSPEKNQLRFAGVSGDSENESATEIYEDNSDDDLQVGRETACQSSIRFRKRAPEPREHRKIYKSAPQLAARNYHFSTGTNSSSTGTTVGRAFEPREHRIQSASSTESIVRHTNWNG